MRLAGLDIGTNLRIKQATHPGDEHWLEEKARLLEEGPHAQAQDSRAVRIPGLGRHQCCHAPRRLSVYVPQ